MYGSDLMTFDKFAQSLHYIVNPDTIRIHGTFRDKKTKQICNKDIFDAKRLSGQSIETIYKVYLMWFNHTRNPYEHEREFVSVKRIKE